MLVINYFVDMERNEFKQNGTYPIFYRNETDRIQNGTERNISDIFVETERNEF